MNFARGRPLESAHGFGVRTASVETQAIKSLGKLPKGSLLSPIAVM